MHVLKPHGTALAVLALTGCTKENIQQCTDASDCDYRVGGSCQTNPATGNQWCAFTDPTCPSGMRWGDITIGDDLAGTCVLGDRDAAMPDAPMTCDAPDRIAFIEAGPNGLDLWAADPDGANAVNLTDTPAGGADVSGNWPFVWSPVEDRVAYGNSIDANRAEIWVVNSDGSNRYRVTSDHLDTAPSWSADGLRIAFTRQDGQLAAASIWWWLASGISGQAVTSSGSAYSPAWFPIGDQIAFHRGNDLYLIDAGGSNETPITTASAAAGSLQPTEWSPQASRILFIGAGSGNPDVWVVDRNGDNLLNVTRTSALETSAHWFPDGERIIYSVVTATGDELRIVNADGTDDALLVSAGGSDRDGTVSPDGTQIAWSSDRDGNREIYVGNADGSNPRRITTTTADDTTPVWRPCH